MSEAQLEHVVPLLLHEDAGPITKKLGANTVSFSSLLGIGSEKVAHFIITTYIKAKGDESELPFWRALLRDLDALFDEGVGADGDGDSWKFVLLFSLSDEMQR